MLHQPVDTSPFAVLAVGGPFAEHIQQTRQLANRSVRAADQAGAVSGPLPANWPFGSGNFTWPLAGWLTQGYRYDHRALDIAAPSGTPVAAADRGVVLRAGWNSQGYGLFVIIDHNIDYVTLYAHLSELFVTKGQVVAQGDLIGTVGSSGNSTGPHLHFEIRDFGRLTNPLELLSTTPAR
jgi:murein DD-endopeptidase MepM/ murein hydrolase activator NlpD